MPHWGMLFTFPPKQLHSSYGSLSAFVELSRKYDPQGKFQNEFLRTYIGESNYQAGILTLNKRFSKGLLLTELHLLEGP